MDKKEKVIWLVKANPPNPKAGYKPSLELVF